MVEVVIDASELLTLHEDAQLGHELLKLQLVQRATVVLVELLHKSNQIKQSEYQDHHHHHHPMGQIKIKKHGLGRKKSS